LRRTTNSIKTTHGCGCPLCKESEQLRFDRAGYRGRLERELANYYNEHNMQGGGCDRGCDLCVEAEKTFTSIARTEPPPI
jgi:hypothetical protein